MIISAFALLLGSTLPSSARAQRPPQSETRSGLYVRSTLGLGVLTSKAASEVTEIPSDDQPTLAADLLVGSPLSGRTACGGALLFESGLLNQVNLGVPVRHANVALLGPFLDGYPFSGRGGHLGGAAGMSWAQFAASDVTSNRVQSFGVGGALWFGEDVPVSAHWTLGPLIRLMAERGLDANDSRNRPWAQSLTLSLSTVYR